MDVLNTKKKKLKFHKPDKMFSHAYKQITLIFIQNNQHFLRNTPADTRHQNNVVKKTLKRCYNNVILTSCVGWVEARGKALEKIAYEIF